jgi:glutamate/tyrosine decarboxylase-like PLP-dependent enzyme
VASTRALLLEAARRAADYLEGLPDRKVRPEPSAVTALSEWDTALPEGPCDPAVVLESLDRIGSPATMAMAGGRFFGFVIGGALPVTLAANGLATAWDQNSGLHDVTPATAELERIALRWLVELFGLPPHTGAGFVTGATVANLTALAAARHAVLKRAGWSVEGDGLFGAPPIDVVIGEEAHPTLMKALGILGLGRMRVTIVPADAQGRMRADRFTPPVPPPSCACRRAT